MRTVLMIALLLGCKSNAPRFCSVAAEQGEPGFCEQGECTWYAGRDWRCLNACDEDADCPDDQTCTLELASCPACDDLASYCDWKS